MKTETITQVFSLLERLKATGDQEGIQAVVSLLKDVHEHAAELEKFREKEWHAAADRVQGARNRTGHLYTVMSAAVSGFMPNG